MKELWEKEFLINKISKTPLIDSVRLVFILGEPWLLWSLHIIYIRMVSFELEKKKSHFRLNYFNLLGKAKTILQA